MTRWAAFAGITAAVLLVLLALARASQSMVGAPTRAELRWLDPLEDGSDHLDVAGTRTRDRRRLTTGELVANVALGQGVLGALLLGGAWYAQVPLAALGVHGPLVPQLALGVAVGAALSGANAVAGLVVSRLGHDPSAALRELLAPASPTGWAALLGVVLPAVAAFEELLFRGALVGAFAAGFGASPWALAVLSSVAFAFGHGVQGRIGVLVTGLLGFALAAAFVLTDSLLVVVVAHYLVNAVEFVVHEGLGAEVAWG